MEGGRRMAFAVAGLLFGGVQFYLLYRITSSLLKNQGRKWPFALAKIFLYTIAGILFLTVFQAYLMPFGIGMGAGMIAAAFIFFCWSAYDQSRNGKGGGD